ncbi:hypothetical protein MVEN_02036300 [Mycena venus]|uniref:Uncharacterized protein n=1 Tax=Mycena venus TaxID=2733690 RepID=A0A8H6XCQ6_9AGAR|nr:hypothetical protein MVEN_02036300 [Mycena venus]
MQNKKAQRKAGSFDIESRHFSPLHKAHTQLWEALLPLSPFRALTPDDIVNADPALTVWETASDSITILVYDSAEGTRPNTNLLLVEAMLRFCEYGAGIPDISGTDQTENLRLRFVRLKCHIEEALLAEARSDERLERQERSDAQCDLDLVRDWAIEIREELLNSGQRTEHWTEDALPWILGYLTTWDNIEFSILRDSGITLVMRDIIYAPMIPVVSYMQPIRNWAASLLKRWKSRPEAESLPQSERTRLGLDITLPFDTPSPSTNTPFPPHILYRVGEIASDLQELKDALTDKAAADHSRIFRALDKVEAWKAEADPLSAKGIHDAVSQFQITPGLRHPAKEVGDRMYSVVAEFNPCPQFQRRVMSISYYTPPDPTPAFRLTFRDKNALPEAIQNSRLGAFGRDVPDNRTWADVTIETTATEQINVLFDRFISTANLQHRHPLAPLTNFAFASTPEPFYSYAGKTNEEIQELGKRLWEVSPFRFVQGQVKDLPITESHLVYYNRSHFRRVGVPELTSKQPRERTLPPSCVAPAHWIRASVPPGGESVWECLPSLAFVGNGHDLYPRATSPPAIASHVYVPRSFERLGIYGLTAYREEVTKDCTPVKLEPPLAAVQARALLGRAIQYEVPVVPLPPLPEGARPKKKTTRSPAADLLGGGQYQEASATLMVGEPCAVPSNRIDTAHPFTPKWVGALALVEEPETPEQVFIPPPAPKAEGPDRLASILEVAAKSPQFEVGISDDYVILVGEITLHGIQETSDSVFTSIERIENCKPGIWQGGRDTDQDNFRIWVHWPEGDVDIEILSWREVTTVSVDGGKISILARGITSPEAILALTGNDEDVEGFVECIGLHGAEEDSFHIPGGVSSYTGGDGGFGVYAASDADGKVIGIKVIGL